MEKLIYLLEDDENIQDLVRCALDISKINCDCFSTNAEFKTAIIQKTPDIVLLDIMLPDGSGLDTLKFIKANYPDTICIMLSALGKETDKVKGLNCGADDYITKPFSILEFTAKINAVFRRIIKQDNIIICGNIHIDQDSMQVLLDDKEINLSTKEFKLLCYSIQNKNKVISREELLTRIWGYETGESRTIDNYISHLRKLGFENYETVFGVGYKFKG